MRSRQACTPVHRPRSVVSFLVSFSYVRSGSPGNSRPYHRRSQTAATHSEHGPTDLEAYAKVSLKKYKPMAARNEDRNVSSGLL